MRPIIRIRKICRFEYPFRNHHAGILAEIPEDEKKKIPYYSELGNN
jgi:hypothetical protein